MSRRNEPIPADLLDQLRPAAMRLRGEASRGLAATGWRSSSTESRIVRLVEPSWRKRTPLAGLGAMLIRPLPNGSSVMQTSSKAPDFRAWRRNSRLLFLRKAKCWRWCTSAALCSPEMPNRSWLPGGPCASRLPENKATQFTDPHSDPRRAARPPPASVYHNKNPAKPLI